MKKRGEMTIGTIIAIALGVAILAFLIFGFSSGWKNLWERVSNIGGTDDNVDSVVSGCQVACSGNHVHDYCNKKRTLRLGDDECEDGQVGCWERYSDSCDGLSGNDTIDFKIRFECPEIDC
jgi:hypothetical protein